MSDFYVLDSHALIWFLEGNPRLSTRARAALSDPQARLGVPAIALVEAIRVVELQKTKIASVDELLKAVDQDGRIVLMPSDRAVIDAFTRLTMLTEIHDRLIVATASTLASAGSLTALITVDRVITAAGIVPVLW